MKRLIIVCEGQTECEFCNNLIAPALSNTSVEACLLKKSNGGIVGWPTIKSQVIKHLNEGKGDEAAYVSMLIDYYGISEKHKFPGWEGAKSIPDKTERMHFLFNKMSADISNHRFIPYIQLHEFEGLLFSNVSSFRECYDLKDTMLSELDKVVDSVGNPEMINNGTKTAPSKRLIKAIPKYDKVNDGTLLAMHIGLGTIRQKCCLFNEWMAKLENINNIRR